MAAATGTLAIDVGTLIADTYEVVGLLGRGGMGSVWVATHRRLPGKKVAVKVLNADLGGDAETLARFRREAEIASRLNHPNIVEVHDYNVLDDGTPYLVLEYLEGEPLNERIERAPLPVDRALSITRQVGAALRAAHAQEVVHRDLKPQNIFLCPTEVDGIAGEQAKVLDFGISKIRGSNTVKTQTATMLGTPQYMAPEQATGHHASVDARTDIFSLGAIVYEMLSGRPAFTGESVPEVVFKVVYEPPRPLAELVPSLSPEVCATVHRALEKKQEDRFPDVSAFVEALSGRPLATLQRSNAAVGAAIAAGNAALAPTIAPGTGAATAAPEMQTPEAQAPESAPEPASAEQDPRTTGARSQAASPVPAERQPPRRRWPLAAGVVGGAAVAVAITLAVVLPGRHEREHHWHHRAAAAHRDWRGGPHDRHRAGGRLPGGPQRDHSDRDRTSTAPSARHASGATSFRAATTGATGTAPTAATTSTGAATTTATSAATGSKRATGTGRRHSANPGKSQRQHADHPRGLQHLSGAARRALVAARRALAHHAPRKAIFAATRSIEAQPNEPNVAAHAIRAEAYCLDRNLGDAHADLRNVRGRLRRRVLRYCRRHETPLE